MHSAVSALRCRGHAIREQAVERFAARSSDHSQSDRRALQFRDSPATQPTATQHSLQRTLVSISGEDGGPALTGIYMYPATITAEFRSAPTIADRQYGLRPGCPVAVRSAQRGTLRAEPLRQRNLSKIDVGNAGMAVPIIEDDIPAG